MRWWGKGREWKVVVTNGVSRVWPKLQSFYCSRQSCIWLYLPNTMVVTLSIKHILCLFVDVIEAWKLVIIKGYDNTTYMIRRTLVRIGTRKTNDERHDHYNSVKLHCWQLFSNDVPGYFYDKLGRHPEVYRGMWGKVLALASLLGLTLSHYIFFCNIRPYIPSQVLIWTVYHFNNHYAMDSPINLIDI